MQNKDKPFGVSSTNFLPTPSLMTSGDKSTIKCALLAITLLYKLCFYPNVTPNVTTLRLGHCYRQSVCCL